MTVPSQQREHAEQNFYVDQLQNGLQILEMRDAIERGVMLLARSRAGRKQTETDSRSGMRWPRICNPFCRLIDVEVLFRVLASAVKVPS